MIIISLIQLVVSNFYLSFFVEKLLIMAIQFAEALDYQLPMHSLYRKLALILFIFQTIILLQD